MYRLAEYYRDVQNVQIPTDCGIYCDRTDKENTLLVNNMRDTLSCYTFTLVTDGWLVIDYNGTQITLKRNDIHIYTPGFRVTIVSVSDDFSGYWLMAEERVALEQHTTRNLIRATYFPIIEMQEPKFTISETDSARLARHMLNIIDYQESNNSFKDECIRLLYSIFLLDLTDIHQHTSQFHLPSERTEELFDGFIRMLPLHFVEHHDIGFYASALNITPTYLSRIVRQITGRTVVDYINQMLIMEAVFLLRTTPQTVSQIAEKLHFADTASFSKFFLRLKGCSPKEYRTGNVSKG